MSDSLQQKTFSGFIWSFVEKFSIQGFAFIQGIILARLLMPSDYGLLSMVSILFSLSYCLRDSGFTTALVKKKERKDIDYSTVYVTNICLSLILTIILCVSASFIAKFYNEPILQQIIYLNALLMFLQSFLAVQETRLSIQLEFKKKGIISITSTIHIQIILISTL